MATTYLLTPQTSDELKRRVKHASENLADRAVDYFDYAKEASADWKQSATDFVDEIKTRGNDADGSQALANYDAATEQLRDQLNTANDTDTSADFDDIVLDGKVRLRRRKTMMKVVKPAPMKCLNRQNRSRLKRHQQTRQLQILKQQISNYQLFDD